VRPLAFQYLKRRRLLSLAMAFMLSSMLFSLAAITLLGFQRGFNAYLGEREDVVVIYDKKSSTPFTGLVPAYLAERLSALEGVKASSPEVIVPSIVKGQSVFLRGIVPREFLKLDQLKMMEGEALELSDAHYVIVGRNVAERLNLKVGEELLVHGVLTERYVELKVKGIFYSGSFLDDEMLVPIFVGQWLRGAGYGYVTLVRVKADGQPLSAILRVVSEEAAQSSPPSSAGEGPSVQPIIPSIIVRFRAEDVGVDVAAQFMRSFMDRYGVTRESLITVSVMVFLFSGLTMSLALRTTIMLHTNELEVLRAVGASKKLLRWDLFVKLLPWSIAAALAGLAIAAMALNILQRYGYLRVLSHTLPVPLDPFVITLDLILTLILCSVTIVKSEIR
jgi:ABC-type lipoprotein release transport system permease subunit